MQRLFLLFILLSNLVISNTAFSQGSDTQQPSTVITAPSVEGELLTGTAGALPGTVSVVLEGTASDEVGGSGLDSVEYFIRSVDLNQWYSPVTGQYSNSPGSPLIPDSLTQQAATETYDWLATIDLPEGNFRVHVRAKDTAGNIEVPTKRRSFDVLLSSASSDFQDPITLITIPSANNETLVGLAGGAPGLVSILLEGTASDEIGGSGIDNVELMIRSVDENLWYNPISAQLLTKWGGPIIPVTLDQQGTSEIFHWSAAVDLPVGDYRVFARSTDVAGNTDSPIPRTTFEASALDTLPPLAAISLPSSEGELLTGLSGVFPGTVEVLLSGTASDEVGGSGVSSVELLMRSIDFGQWYNPVNGQYSTSSLGTGTLATLTQQGTSETYNWNAAIELPAGIFRAFVRVMDVAQNIQTPLPRQRFNVIDFWSPPLPPTN